MQASAGIPFKARLWKDVDEVLEDRGLRLGSALDSAFGQSGGSSPEARASLQGCCPQGASAGTPGARGQGCPAAECRCST